MFINKNLIWFSYKRISSPENIHGYIHNHDLCLPRTAVNCIQI